MTSLCTCYHCKLMEAQLKKNTPCTCYCHSEPSRCSQCCDAPRAAPLSEEAPTPPFGTGDCDCGFAGDGMYGDWVISPACPVHGQAKCDCAATQAAYFFCHSTACAYRKSIEAKVGKSAAFSEEAARRDAREYIDSLFCPVPTDREIGIEEGWLACAKKRAEG